MSDTKISQLAAAAILTGAELIALAQPAVPGPYNSVQTPLSSLAFWGISTQEAAAGCTTANTNIFTRRYTSDRYLMVGDGATDNTAQLQRAINIGLPIEIGPGTFNSNAVTGAYINLWGSSFFKTTLQCTDLSSNNFITQTTSNYAPELRSMQITPSGTKAGGYAFWIQPTSGECNSPRLIDVFINNFPNGFGGTAVSNFYFGAGSQIYGANLQTGILVRNDNNADSGDSVIEGTINATNQTAILIYQQSSGGLKLIGPKLLGGLHHYYMNWANTGNSSDLIVSGGSSEGAYGDHFLFARQGGTTKTFTNVDITGMQFELTSPAGNNWAINASDASGFLSNVNIKITVHNYNTAGGGVKLDYISVSASGVGGGLVDGCCMLGNGGTSVGCYLGTNNYAGSVKYGINSITGFGTTLAPSNTASVNSITYQDQQTVTGTVACTTAYGSLFRGTATLTAPQSFCVAAPIAQQNVTMTVAPGSAGGGVSAFPYSVTLNQIAVGATAAASGNVSVSATMYGVI